MLSKQDVVNLVTEVQLRNSCRNEVSVYPPPRQPPLVSKATVEQLVSAVLSGTSCRLLTITEHTF